MNIYKFYIPWSPELLLEGIANFLKSFGAIVNVGIWMFLILMGIVFVVSLINRFVG